MKQWEQVVEAMESHGGYATFTELNRIVDTSSWRTKTPAATIRRIVQQCDKFYRIMPGQWGLAAMRGQIERIGATAASNEYTHAYYQGLLVDVGNAERYSTYVPPQDKNRLYAHGTLGDAATTTDIYDFTYERLLRRAKTVDTIWFNERFMPNSFFEVEHITTMLNSLDKFLELQDFHAKFLIVSSVQNGARFDDVMRESRYAPIKGRVKFYDYDKLARLHYAKMIEREVRI